MQGHDEPRRLIDEIGDRAPDEADVADLRATLYGLYAILRLHTAQEDEAHPSLGDERETTLHAVVTFSS